MTAPEFRRDAGRIEGGIEWYTWLRPDGDGEEEDCRCARCGSSVAHIPCGWCGGDGGYFGEEIASGYDYGWIDEDEWYTCDQCCGGHWPHCISSPEWCNANPMPGREDVPSTALDSACWYD